jgi:hypothetical protein
MKEFGNPHPLRHIDERDNRVISLKGGSVALFSLIREGFR